MLNRLARRHERAYLTIFFAIGILVALFAALAAARDGQGALVAGAWAGGMLVTGTVMAARHRAGRLIIRDPEERAREMERNQEVPPWSILVVIATIAVGAIAGGGVVLAFFGGVFTVLAPVMLWIAFVLRPDQREGEYLD